jgi:ABC-2 type transport system permease protein
MKTEAASPAPHRGNLTWVPFVTLLRREIARFMKVIAQTVVTPMINSTLYLLIFGVSLGGSIELRNGVSYLAFLIPGLVMMACLNNAFQNSSSSIVSAKFGGDLEDLKVSPLSNQQIVWALSLGGLIRGGFVGAVTLVVGTLFYYFSKGEALPMAHPLILLFFMIVGGLAFAKMGICVAFWAKTFDQLSAIGAFILLPLLYLGGVFFSIDGLHPFWKTVARFNPLLYMINGVRFGILGVADVGLEQAALVSVASLVFFHVVALRSLKTASFVRW